MPTYKGEVIYGTAATSVSLRMFLQQDTSTLALNILEETLWENMKPLVSDTWYLQSVAVSDINILGDIQRRYYPAEGNPGEGSSAVCPSRTCGLVRTFADAGLIGAGVSGLMRIHGVPEDQTTDDQWTYAPVDMASLLVALAAAENNFRVFGRNNGTPYNVPVLRAQAVGLSQRGIGRPFSQRYQRARRTRQPTAP